MAAGYLHYVVFSCPFADHTCHKALGLSKWNLVLRRHEINTARYTGEINLRNKFAMRLARERKTFIVLSRYIVASVYSRNNLKLQRTDKSYNY